MIADANPRSAVADLDAELLVAVQAYLRCLRDHAVPSPPMLAAWDQFYAAYDPHVRRAVFHCGVSLAEREDCVQDVWMEIALHLPSFLYLPSRGRFVGWVHIVARRRTTKHLARGCSLPQEAMNGNVSKLQSLAPGPAASFECRDLQYWVQDALAEFRKRVSLTSYRVLVLSWLEDRPVAEIAGLLDLTPQQVWARRHWVRREFRGFLASRKRQ